MSRGGRAIGWTSASMLGAAGINYGYTLVLATFLDAREYTVFAAGQGILLVMGTMSSAAAPWLLAHEIARHPDDHDRRRNAVGFALKLNALLGVAAAIPVGLVASSFAPASVCITLGLATVVIFVSSASVGHLQGEGRFSGLAGYRTAEVLIKVVAGLIAVALGAGAIGGLSGYLASDLIMFVVGCWIMRADLSLRGGLRYPRSLWVKTLGLGAVQGLIAVLSNIDTVLVAAIPNNATQTASYQLASTLSRAPLFFSTAVSTVAFREMNADVVHSRQAARRALTLFARPALAVALLTATAPASLVDRVVPDGLGDTVHFLPITAATGLALGFANLYATFFQATMRFRTAVVSLTAAIALAGTLLAVGEVIDKVRGLGLGMAVATTAGALLICAFSRTLVARGTRSWRAEYVWGGLLVVGAALSWLARGDLATWAVMAVVVVCAAVEGVRRSLKGQRAEAGHPASPDGPATTMPADALESAHEVEIRSR